MVVLQKRLTISFPFQITSLPTELCSLPNMNNIQIDGLKLIDPPLIIAQQGFDSIKQYMRQRAEASAPWNYLQLVIVGPKDSGKTHLSARLRDVKFNNPGPTKGVQVKQCNVCSYSLLLEFAKPFETITCLNNHNIDN